MKDSRKALAMVNVLIFAMVFTILSGILLVLLASHSRHLEASIRRTKAQYAAEAGSVAALDALRRGAAPPSTVSVEWTYNASGSPVAYKTVQITNQTGGGINGTMLVNALGNYTYNW